jgi:hypothetical protein
VFTVTWETVAPPRTGQGFAFGHLGDKEGPVNFVAGVQVLKGHRLWGATNGVFRLVICGPPGGSGSTPLPASAVHLEGSRLTASFTHPLGISSPRFRWWAATSGSCHDPKHQVYASDYVPKGLNSKKPWKSRHLGVFP